MSAHEDAVTSAYREIAGSLSDHLPDVMVEVNKARHFDGQGRAEALQRWIAERRRQDPDFNAIEFLEAFIQKYPRDVEGLVTLALEYKRAGNKALSIQKIDAALSVRRYDLYASKVALSVFAWAGGKNSDGMAETDEWLKGRHCDLPFSNFDAMPNGDVFVCCGDWLAVPIGNINKDTADEIWNSPVAVELRESIADGSFRYCNRVSCQDIVNRTLPPARPDARQRLRNPGPTRLVLSHDNSCNLSCPSCRSELILAKKQEQDRLNGLVDTVFMPLMKEARIVRISGSGDPFASNHYRTLLKEMNPLEFPHLRVDLHTNAQLFDEKAWTDLELEGKVWHVEISIDAAAPKTYAAIRRGGSFERLLKNLAFVQGLRQRGAFKALTFSFVVQQENYREMPAFVRLADEYGADNVEFRMILNWGVMSPEEFNAKCIGSPKHPEHEQYLEVLKNPELHRPNVKIPPEI